MIKASLGYSVNFRLTCLIQIKTQRKKRREKGREQTYNLLKSLLRAVAQQLLEGRQESIRIPEQQWQEA